MELSTIAFQQILIMLILMLVGVLSEKLGILDEYTNKKLSNFLVLVITPAVVIMAYHRPFDPEVLGELIWAFLLSIVSFAISIAVTELFFRKKGDNTFPLEKFGATMPNIGFLGIPLINGIFGDMGVLFMTAYLSVLIILLWTYGVMTMTGKKDISSIKKALLSPPLVAVFFGFIIFIFSIPLPRLVYAPATFLGNMNTPLAMTIAGVSLSKINIFAMLKNKQVYLVCVLTLVILPIINILVFMPFNISTLVFSTIIVSVACPIAANIIPFSYLYDQDHVFATQLFAMSTVFSAVTIPFILWLIR